MHSSHSYTAKVVLHGRDVSLEWHDTPQLWVAYFCGCPECPKGTGKTIDDAVADLEEFCGYERSTATTERS